MGATIQTGILESATEPVFPRLDPADFEPDEDIRRLGQVLGDIIFRRDPTPA